jgi:U3 small nucleolar RNA-associated protein 3
MNIRVEELQGTFLVIKDYLGENEAISDLDKGLVDYMGLKEQLLLTYCINVVFYLYMKAMGKVVENHPLMKQLLQVRYLMERMVPLDKQYKEDLEDLVQRAVGREEGEEEEEEESGDGKGSNDQDAQEGDEEDEENDEEEDKEDVQSCDGEVQGEDENETEERRREEEGEFEQMTLTKRRRLAKKAKKGAAARLNNFEDIGDIEKLEAPRPSRPLGKASKEKSDYDDHGDGDAGASDEFMRMLMDAADEAPGGKGKRRPAPSGAMDLEDEPNIMEEFIDKKKAFLAHKAGKYVPEPRYGGREAEEVEAGSGKRAASYEIMKNKGLTPHRKKANRNPRVKKKQMYEKSVKARKGQVREVITGKAGSYGGETTGIKNITRSRKIY